ncbi:MAG TPA: hypothetical protein VII42_14715 [Caulobacteraceae bacterium]|jgi:hypothetical protein
MAEDRTGRRGPAEAPPSADKFRLSVRLATEYFLRSMQLLVGYVDGDLVTALVFLAIISANVSHLNADGPDAPHADTDDVPPDAVRKPISVLALAGSLNLPYETTRRHVAKMLQNGQCERVAGGLIVPARVLLGARHTEVMAANLTNLRRLFRALNKAGVDLS